MLLTESSVSRPSTLDAYVFGFLAPLYKVRFPKIHLQEHLKQLSNLCRLCDDILDSYFRHGPAGESALASVDSAQKSSFARYLRLWFIARDLVVCPLHLLPCSYVHGERAIWPPPPILWTSHIVCIFFISIAPRSGSLSSKGLKRVCWVPAESSVYPHQMGSHSTWFSPAASSTLPLNRNQQQIDFGEVTPMILLLENDCTKLEIE